MKHFLLICITILCGSQAMAQAYPAGSYWRYRDKMDDKAVKYSMSIMYTITQQKQVVDGRMSNRLIYRIGNLYDDNAREPDRAVGWYAEQDKVGYLHTDDGKKLKLYDYNLQVGDTMPFTKVYALNLDLPSQAKAEITAIDNRNIDGVVRKVYELENGRYAMIENIGLDGGIFLLDQFVGEHAYNQPEFVCYNSGSFIYPQAGGCKYMTATLWPTTVAGTANEVNVALYPNPCSNVLHIETPANTTTEVYDMVGRLVMKTNTQSINSSEWRDGLYIVKLFDADQQLLKTEKVVKQ